MFSILRSLPSRLVDGGERLGQCYGNLVMCCLARRRFLGRSPDRQVIVVFRYFRDPAVGINVDDVAGSGRGEKHLY